MKTLPAPAAPLRFLPLPAGARLLRPALGALLVLVTTGATRAGTPDAPAALPVTVQALDHEHIRVRIANPGLLPSRVQVLRLSNGQTLFEQATQDAAYGHRFKFGGLPAGRYALVLAVGPQQYRYTVEVPGCAQQAVAIRSIKVRLPKAGTGFATAAL